MNNTMFIRFADHLQIITYETNAYPDAIARDAGILHETIQE